MSDGAVKWVIGGVVVEGLIVWWWIYARLSPEERQQRLDRANGKVPDD